MKIKELIFEAPLPTQQDQQGTQAPQGSNVDAASVKTQQAQADKIKNLEAAVATLLNQPQAGAAQGASAANASAGTSTVAPDSPQAKPLAPGVATAAPGQGQPMGAPAPGAPANAPGTNGQKQQAVGTSGTVGPGMGGGTPTPAPVSKPVPGAPPINIVKNKVQQDLLKPK